MSLKDTIEYKILEAKNITTISFIVRTQNLNVNPNFLEKDTHTDAHNIYNTKKKFSKEYILFFYLHI